MALTEYTQSVHTACTDGRVFTVRNLIPNFTDEQRAETREKIEGCLYDIFRKYMT